MSNRMDIDSLTARGSTQEIASGQIEPEETWKKGIQLDYCDLCDWREGRTYHLHPGRSQYRG